VSGKETRALKIRCTTWDQVEAFYTRKLRGRGELKRQLAIRVQFAAAPGSLVTLALCLPNEMVFAIDGTVAAIEPGDGKRSEIRLDLHGLSEETLGRLKHLVADARVGHSLSKPPAGSGKRDPAAAPPATPTDVLLDEHVDVPRLPTVEDVSQELRDVFFAVEAQHRHMRESAAHEVLDVAWDASVEEIRRGYFRLTKLYHPDRFAKYRSAAVSHLASELFVHINRAYDRMREAAAAAGNAIIAGPALLPHQGWVVGFEDVGDHGTPRPAAAPKPLPAAPTPSEILFATRPRATAKAPTPIPTPFSADALFDDVPAPEKPEEKSQVSELFATGALSERQRHRVAELGLRARELLHEQKPDSARELLADALHIDPRNRELRALYHVASGYCMMASDKAVDATTQFETALAHDPACAEARTALQGRRKPRKTGMFKRFFER
jgi:hypothetical protein